MRQALVEPNSPLWVNHHRLALTLWATIPSGDQSVVSAREEIRDHMFSYVLPVLCHMMCEDQLVGGDCVYVGPGFEAADPSPLSDPWPRDPGGSVSLTYISTLADRLSWLLRSRGKTPCCDCKLGANLCGWPTADCWVHGGVSECLCSRGWLQ